MALPNTYYRLNYIANTGSSYINTLIKPTGKTKLEIDFRLTNTSYNSTWGSGVAYTEFTSGGHRFGINVVSNINIACGNNSTLATIPSDTNRHKIIVNDNGNCYADDVLLGTRVFTGTSSYNLPLFACMWAGSLKSYKAMELYSCQISEDDVLVRNFIPAMRKSDNVVGLYDDVNDVFYTNNGSGSFTYGSIVYEVSATENPTDSGTITGTGYYPSGSNMSLLANANSGYLFDYWEYNGITDYSNPLSLVVNSDLSLIANFKLNYQITLTYDSTLGNATYDWINGTQIQLVATPNSNAQFKGWYINSIPISTNTTYTYTVLSDVIIEARFERVWDITTNVSGNGSIQYNRGTDRNDVVFSVIADTNNHFVKYVVDGVEYTTTPLTLYLTQDTTITAYFEENERYHITVNSNFPYGSFYISDNDVFAGTIITVWARPFPDYNFVRWQDGTLENPRQIEVNADITLVAEYQRSFETNGIYQYRCYIKDQLDLEAPPKAFMRVDNFDIKRDTMTKSNSTIYVMDTATNVNNGDVLVVYDPMGTNLYEGVVKSMEGNKIICSQMPSFYKGLWIYNVSPQDYLEHEIAVLLQNYANGQIYRSSYTDTLVAQRLGGITINYVGSTAVNLPTDLDDNDNEKLTQKDMEQWIYELYENYGIIFDFQINMAGANYVTIKTPSYETIKVGNNMYAIQDMSPITEIEETNRLIIFSSKKVYRTTYVATKNGVVEQPTSTNNRFDITNTKVVFSDDDVDTLIANNLPEQMYNHKLTFTLIIKNFLYEFGDFNLGGELDVWGNDDYYNTVLTGYQIKKASNQNITEVGFTCGKVRVALTKKLTMGVVL